MCICVVVLIYVTPLLSSVEVQSAVEKIEEPDIVTRIAHVFSSLSIASSPEVLINCLVLVERIHTCDSGMCLCVCVWGRGYLCVFLCLNYYIHLY